MKGVTKPVFTLTTDPVYGDSSLLEKDMWNKVLRSRPDEYASFLSDKLLAFT